jgi:ureidoacrylate peracid hydrolase
MTEYTTPPEASPSFEPQTIEEVLHPSHTALLVVDMENDFLAEGGFFDKKQHIVGGDYRNMRAAVNPTLGMIEMARKAGVMIIFTQGYEDVKFRSGPDKFRAIQWDEHEGDGSVNCESGTWGAEFYEPLKPQEGDIVIEKHRWSAFSGREKRDGQSYDPNDPTRRTLKQILDQLGVKTLVATGVTAETCIETTVRDGYEEGFFIVIPENSVGSNNKEQLAARLDYWRRQHVANVLPEEEIGNIWENSLKEK